MEFYSMPLTSRFIDAVELAASLHRTQRRKGSGTPYLGHLLGVCALVMEAGGTEDECIAALLHDAVEDQGGAQTAERIRRQFGAEVASIVAGCSEDRSQGMDWRQRKEGAIRNVSTAGPSVLLVVSADKLHNGRSLIRAHSRLGDDVWSRFKGGRDGTIWYYRSMAAAIAAAGHNPLLPELQRTVDELGSLGGQRK